MKTHTILTMCYDEEKITRTGTFKELYEDMKDGIYAYLPTSKKHLIHTCKTAKRLVDLMNMAHEGTYLERKGYYWVLQ